MYTSVYICMSVWLTYKSTYLLSYYTYIYIYYLYLFMFTYVHIFTYITCNLMYTFVVTTICNGFGVIQWRKKGHWRHCTFWKKMATACKARWWCWDKNKTQKAQKTRNKARKCQNFQGASFDLLVYQYLTWVDRCHATWLRSRASILAIFLIYHGRYPQFLGGLLWICGRLARSTRWIATWIFGGWNPTWNWLSPISANSWLALWLHPTWELAMSPQGLLEEHKRKPLPEMEDCQHCRFPD